MRTYVKLTLTAATAAVVLGAAVSSAAARRIELSAQRYHHVWPSINITAQFATITCPLTLEGSFHSKTTSKVIGQLVGYVSRVTVGNSSCARGHLTALTETLPWHITYEGFGGILPRITEIHLLYIGWAFRFELLGASCLWKTTTTEPAEGWVFIEPNGGQVSQIEPNTSRFIRTSEGCLGGSTLRVQGISEVFAEGVETGSSARLTVRLVQ